MMFLFSAGSKLQQAIMEGFDSLYKFIHSGEVEELADVVPFEDFTDYTAEDFIQDHATVTVGEDDTTQNEDESEDVEPSAKRMKNDLEFSENEVNNDYDMRYGSNAPGIPSLLNLNLQPPRRIEEDKNSAEESPAWETSNYNGPFGPNQNSNNNSASNKDRRDGRQRPMSRWSSSRR